MRFRMLLTMAALFAVIVCVIAAASPYAPVVEPVREIEEIWAIEDSRQESEAPLVTRLENHGQALGYDAQSNTFYCTLGMDNTDVWPQIHLTAPGAKDLQICFVDDTADGYLDDGDANLFVYTDAGDKAEAVADAARRLEGILGDLENIPVRAWSVSMIPAGQHALGRELDAAVRWLGARTADTLAVMRQALH